MVTTASVAEAPEAEMALDSRVAGERESRLAAIVIAVVLVYEYGEKGGGWRGGGGGEGRGGERPSAAAAAATYYSARYRRGAAAPRHRAPMQRIYLNEICAALQIVPRAGMRAPRAMHARG